MVTWESRLLSLTQSGILESGGAHSSSLIHHHDHHCDTKHHHHSLPPTHYQRPPPTTHCLPTSIHHQPPPTPLSTTTTTRYDVCNYGPLSTMPVGLQWDWYAPPPPPPLCWPLLMYVGLQCDHKYSSVYLFQLKELITLLFDCSSLCRATLRK